MNCVALIVAFLTFSPVLGTRIAISPSGGYSEIVVGIDMKIDEGEEIIQQLKELMTNASHSLYLATRGSVYFEDITIAIPSTWSHKPEYESSLKNNMNDADVLVSLDYSDDPVTIQPGGCGEAGLNIQLSPNYLRSMKSPTTMERLGIPGKRFVQEWAKLRYGVFDEFVTEKMEKDRRFSRFFDHNGNKRPATCPLDLVQWPFYENRRKESCDPNQSTVGCYLTVQNDYVSVNSSIMYSASYDSVFTFCDEHNHNRRAMNKHNLLCNYRSTWSVISSHADFKVAPVQNMVQPRNTAPKFRFVRTLKDNGKTVLVLDISGSMAAYNGAPIKLLHQTATSHIMEFVPDGSQLGIVVFGSNSKSVHPIVKVDNATRKSLADKIPTLADGGGTAIGKGLNAGLEMLKLSGVAEGGVLLLITDGEENAAPYINDVKGTILNERVIVSVIAYGDKADKKLEALALETGGRASIFREINNVEAKTESLQDTILQASSAQADINFEPVRLKSKPFILHSEETRETVFLDHELGKKTIFYFSWKNNDSPEIELISPSGVQYNSNSQGTFHAKDKNKIRFRFPDAETGSWTVIIRKLPNENPDVSFTLTSEPKDAKKQPVRVRSWTSAVEVDPNANRTSVRVYARVTKNDTPVLKAAVVGIITGPNGNKNIRLIDDGTGVDASADDGIYTGVATLGTFSGNGRYSIRARVSGQSKAVLKKKKFRSNRPNRPKRASTINRYSKNVDEDLVVSFEREVEAGTIMVSNWTPDPKDITAPNRVVDLQLVNVTWVGEDKLVTISWTEAGDDLTEGNAASIDIRCSLSFDRLLMFYDDQFKLDDTLLVDGNASPGASGQYRQATFRVPRNYLIRGSSNVLNGFRHRNIKAGDQAIQMFVALRYADDEGNRGDVSNIISVSFIKPEDPCKKMGYRKCAQLRAECLIAEGDSYTCNCSAGFAFGADGICTGLSFVSLGRSSDACQKEGNNQCRTINAQCVTNDVDNTTFSCICALGLEFSLNGVCTDVCQVAGNEDCAKLNAMCVIDRLDNKGYNCRCPLGLSEDENGFCADVCVVEGNKICESLIAQCVINEHNSSTYICQCPPDLKKAPNGVCSDSCTLNGNDLCKELNALCVLHNDRSTFSCHCSHGLWKDTNSICSDICQLKGNEACSKTNSNCQINKTDPGTYNCSCATGKFKSNKSATCVDACEDSGNQVCAQFRATCQVNPNDYATYGCECPRGLFADVNSYCTDICTAKGNEVCSKRNAGCLLDENDHSKYTCKCNGQYAEGPNGHCIKKQFDVKIYPNRKQSVNQGQNVTFFCRDEGPTRSKVKWNRKFSQTNPMPTFYKVENGRLDIYSVQLRDSGTYLCYVVNSSTTQKGSRKIAILLVIPLICDPQQYQCYSGRCVAHRTLC